MRGLEHETSDARRRRESDERGNHRAVAVAPENRQPEIERVDDGARLERCGLVKARLETLDRRRSSVARTIRDDDSVPRSERRDRPIERIDLISPAAVKEDERCAGTTLAVMDTDRLHPLRQLLCVRFHWSYRIRSVRTGLAFSVGSMLSSVTSIFIA